MSVEGRTIAVLAANPALGSILGRAFEDSGAARVPVFSTLAALSVFLRIAPVDAAVLSLDQPWADAAEIVGRLKQTARAANPLIEFVVLADATPIATVGRGQFVPLGKPASPATVIEAVAGTLASGRRRSDVHSGAPNSRREFHRPRAAILPIIERQGNVIPLFGNRASPSR
jgi:two-component system phosphate regulon response regulator PhoB